MSLHTVANYGPIFFPFGDRQTQQLFLPRHKSSGCFHTLSTGTAPFIKENLFRAKQGERQQRSGEPDELLLKSFNENV